MGQLDNFGLVHKGLLLCGFEVQRLLFMLVTNQVKHPLCELALVFNIQLYKPKNSDENLNDCYAPNFEKVGDILVSACQCVCLFVCVCVCA